MTPIQTSHTAKIELLSVEDAKFLKWNYRVTLHNADRAIRAIAYTDDVLTASLIANALSPNVEVVA